MRLNLQNYLEIGVLKIETLSEHKILKDLKVNYTLRNSSLFFTIGLIITFSPILYFRSITLNALIGFGVCLLCFGMPFGFFWGIKRFVKAKKIKKSILNGDFNIIEDSVKSMRMLNSGVTNDNSDKYCQIEFENYSSVTGQYFTISRRLFDKTKENDVFYLIYIHEIKNTISIYPKKSTALSNTLAIKKVN